MYISGVAKEHLKVRRGTAQELKKLFPFFCSTIKCKLNKCVCVYRL